MEFVAKKFDELTNREVYEMLKCRSAIFVVEKEITYLDMDDIDYDALHCFLVEDGKVKAYMRAFYVEEGIVKLGRVLTMQHGIGHGRLLLDKSLKAIDEVMPNDKLVMHAQVPVKHFYERFGFKSVGEEFLEEGIKHIYMER